MAARFLKQPHALDRTCQARSGWVYHGNKCSRSAATQDSKNALSRITVASSFPLLSGDFTDLHEGPCNPVAAAFSSDRDTN